MLNLLVAAVAGSAAIISASLVTSAGAESDQAVWPTASRVVSQTDAAQPSGKAIDEDLLIDMETIAAEEGITVDEAVLWYGWHGDFSIVAAKVEAAYPVDFAGSAVDEGRARSAQISFVGAMPQGAADLIAQSPVPVKILEGASLSLADRATVVESVHKAAYGQARGQRARSVSTSFDADAYTVRTTVSAKGVGLDIAAVKSAANSALNRDLPSTVRKVPEVAVALVAAGDAASADTIRGGAYLTTGATLSAACTSGWPVRKNGSTQKGLITADHCSNSLRYSGRAVLTYRSRLPVNRGDIDYRSSTEAVGTSFYYASGEYRGITGLGTPTDNQYLCKYGRTSGNTCDRVRDRTTCRDSYCNLVDMDNREAAGGDSGGPWYSGNTAYGVHSGYHTALLQKRDQFTPLYNTLGDLAVSLNY